MRGVYLEVGVYQVITVFTFFGGGAGGGVGAVIPYPYHYDTCYP